MHIACTPVSRATRASHALPRREQQTWPAKRECARVKLLTHPNALAVAFNDMFRQFGSRGGLWFINPPAARCSGRRARSVVCGWRTAFRESSGVLFSNASCGRPAVLRALSVLLGEGGSLHGDKARGLVTSPRAAAVRRTSVVVASFQVSLLRKRSVHAWPSLLLPSGRRVACGRSCTPLRACPSTLPWLRTEQTSRGTFEHFAEVALARIP